MKHNHITFCLKIPYFYHILEIYSWPTTKITISCNQLFNIFQLLYVTHRIQIWRLFSKSETVWIENPPLDKALTFKKRLPHKHDSLSSVFINFLIYLIPINLSP